MTVTPVRTRRLCAGALVVHAHSAAAASRKSLRNTSFDISSPLRRSVTSTLPSSSTMRVGRKGTLANPHCDRGFRRHEDFVIFLYRRGRRGRRGGQVPKL